MHKKTLKFQMAFKEASMEDGKLRIKGLASTPEIDRYDDIVNPLAFSGAMENYMKNPVVLLQHDGNKVLGQVVDFAISPAGLEVTAELTNDIENAFKNIMDKNLRGFSIGFICKAFADRTEGDRIIREITELDLIEISVVSTPANPSSLFSLSKSIKAFFSKIDEEEAKEIAGEEVSAPVAEETPAPEAPTTEETTPETTEEASDVPATETDPKTEKEAPEGETPATIEETPSDVPATDNSEPVKAGEETPEEISSPSAEVESLTAKVEELSIALTEEKAKSAEILAKLEASEAKNVESEAKYTKLEKEYLSIEVKPGTKIFKGKLETRSTTITDAQVFRLMKNR